MAESTAAKSAAVGDLEVETLSARADIPLVEGEEKSRRWRAEVERYHYLGCRVPFGSQLALLGAESRSGTGMSALDLAGLEDAGARRLDWMA
jgi:hypothetical protein